MSGRNGGQFTTREVSQFERFLRGGRRSSVVVSLSPSSGLAIKAADDEARIRSLLGHAQASTATRLSLALRTIDPASVAAINMPDLQEDAAALLREALAEGGPDDPRVEPIVRRFEAQLDARRQQVLGVSHYVWRSRDDETVRPAHAARDDQVFSWDEEPPGGHPGEDFGCRCYAEPVIDDEPYEPMGGLELTLFTETAEIIGGLEAARDAGIETWNGVAILAEGLWRTTVYGLSELLVPLGAEWLRTRRDAVRGALQEELSRYDERLEQAWEALKRTPELARAFADYLAAVEARAAGAVDAYRGGEITEAEFRDALRERSYLRTTIALSLAPTGAGQAALIARLAGRSRRITRFLADESGAAGVSDASALRAAAAAQRNLDVLRGIKTLPGAGVLWGRGIQQQGRPWEDALDATGEGSVRGGGGVSGGG